MRALTHLAAAAILAAFLPLAAAAPAKQTPDREQPVNIDADKVTVDDRNKVHIFEGNVILTRGSLTIKGEKLVITQDTEGFHNGVATAATGQLASFRQKRTSDGVWIDGEAERIEYNSKNERARLFNRARVQSGGKLVSGQFIEYDIATENYLVTDAPRRHDLPPGERVHVVIPPKTAPASDSTN